MSDQTGIPTRPDEEARSTLAMVAAQNQRRNAPRALPLAALVLLAGSFVWLIAARTDHAHAADRLDIEASRGREVARMLASIEALAKQGLDEGVGVGPAMPDLLTRIQRAADNAQVEVGAPTEGSDVKDGVRARSITYRLSTQQLGPSLDWINRAMATAPGLELTDFEMRPQQRVVGRGRDRNATGGGWNINVTFRRLEQE